MPKNIIITCGTSLTENLKDENLFNFDELAILETLSKKRQSEEKLDIENKIEKYLEDNDLSKLSAELTIIYKLLEKKDITKEDNIFLYTSETELGKRLGKTIKEILEKDGFENINYNFIEGFVVENIGISEDSKAYKVFQNKAIKNYFSQLEEIKKDGNQTIMCPVGGYKALIPYSSLYAMVQGWEIKYIYEDSDEIIDLPNGMLSYLLLKAGIKDKNFSDVLKELEDGENSIFSQNVEDFENITKLVEATNRFINLGDLSGFNGIEFKDEKLKGVNELLKKFVEFDIKIKFGQIRQKEEISQIIEEIKKFSNEKILLKPIFDKLKKEFENFNLENELEYYFSILEFYKKHKMYLQGFLFMREFLIDLFIYIADINIKYSETDDNKYLIDESGKCKGPWLFRDLFSNKIISSLLGKTKNNQFNYSKLEKDENGEIICLLDRKIEIKDKFFNAIKILSKDRKKEIKDLFDSLRKIRNYFAHSKFDAKNEFSSQNLENTFEHYFQKLESFKNYVLNSKDG